MSDGLVIESGDLLDDRDRYIELLGELSAIEHVFCEKNKSCHTCELLNLCVTVKRL